MVFIVIVYVAGCRTARGHPWPPPALAEPAAGWLWSQLSVWLTGSWHEVQTFTARLHREGDSVLAEGTLIRTHTQGQSSPAFWLRRCSQTPLCWQLGEGPEQGQGPAHW